MKLHSNSARLAAGGLALTGLLAAGPALAAATAAAEPDGLGTLLKFLSCAFAMAVAKTWIAAGAALLSCSSVIASQRTVS